MKFGRIVCDDIQATSKVCTKCGEEKSFSEFYPCSHAKFGLRYECKDCSKRAIVDKRTRDVNGARAYGRMYYAKNRDVLLKAANDNRSTPRGKIDNAISGGVSRGIRRGSKNGRKSFDLLGYSLADLMAGFPENVVGRL